MRAYHRPPCNKNKIKFTHKAVHSASHSIRSTRSVNKAAAPLTASAVPLSSLKDIVLSRLCVNNSFSILSSKRRIVPFVYSLLRVSPSSHVITLYIPQRIPFLVFIIFRVHSSQCIFYFIFFSFASRVPRLGADRFCTRSIHVLFDEGPIFQIFGSFLCCLVLRHLRVYSLSCVFSFCKYELRDSAQAVNAQGQSPSSST